MTYTERLKEVLERVTACLEENQGSFWTGSYPPEVIAEARALLAERPASGLTREQLELALEFCNRGEQPSMATLEQSKAVAVVYTAFEKAKRDAGFGTISGWIEAELKRLQGE